GSVRGVASLCGKALAEFRSRVFAGEDEEIVKGGDGPPQLDIREPLIQAVEQSGAARPDGFHQQFPARIARHGRSKRPEKAVRTVSGSEITGVDGLSWNGGSRWRSAGRVSAPDSWSSEFAVCRYCRALGRSAICSAPSEFMALSRSMQCSNSRTFPGHS